MSATDSKEQTRQFTARIPVDLLDALEQVAAQNDRTPSGELRRALRHWLSNGNNDAAKKAAA